MWVKSNRSRGRLLNLRSSKGDRHTTGCSVPLSANTPNIFGEFGSLLLRRRVYHRHGMSNRHISGRITLHAHDRVHLLA